MALLFYSLQIFPVSWWSFTRVISDRKSFQLSKTLLRILAELKNVLVSMVILRFPTPSALLPIFWGSSQVHQLQ